MEVLPQPLSMQNKPVGHLLEGKISQCFLHFRIKGCWDLRCISLEHESTWEIWVTWLMPHMVKQMVWSSPNNDFLGPLCFGVCTWVQFQWEGCREMWDLSCEISRWGIHSCGLVQKHWEMMLGPIGLMIP